MSSPPSERRIVFLVGAVQFINILDFMMVSPLGQDFSDALHFPASKIGLVVGAYTAAACVAGLAGAFFLDRFDRRSALAVSMAGLIAGTAAGGLATGLPTLMAARIVAGAFGGPATSIALAIIADAIPAERRGKALGAVAGAFAAATVLGVPAGLWLAAPARGGWRTPFFAVAGLGLVVAAAAVALLPRFRGHLAATRERPSFRELFRPTVLLSWTMTAAVMMGTFAMVPNLSTYYLGNLRYPRADLSSLYLAGGTLSFFATRLVGKLVDRHGSFRVGTAGTLWLLGVLYAGFISPGVPPGVPAVAMALFLAFMLSNSLRSVPLNTLTSKVPAPAERARFMSIQSAVQHLASSAGAFLGTALLRESSGGGLDGFPRVAIVSMALAALFPVLSWAVEGRVTPRVEAEAEVEPAG
jgi:predicted MFS family arabinose efflux permease